MAGEKGVKKPRNYYFMKIQLKKLFHGMHSITIRIESVSLCKAYSKAALYCDKYDLSIKSISLCRRILPVKAKELKKVMKQSLCQRANRTIEDYIKKD